MGRTKRAASLAGESEAKRRRVALPMRRPDSLQRDLEMGDFILDITEAIEDTNGQIRVAPARYLGNGMMQCTFLHRVDVDFNSSATHALVTSAAQVGTTNPTFGKNIMSIDRINGTAGYQKSQDINRIFPFSILWFQATSTSAIDARVRWDVVRIPVLEYWRIVMTEYEVDLNTVFLMDSFPRSSFAADFWTSTGMPRPPVF